MPYFKTKICGLQSLEDALSAVAAGAWALGFNFYKPSPRYLKTDKAPDIISNLPKGVLKVGIFVNEPGSHIVSIMDTCGLDLAQVYNPQDLKPAQKKCMILALNEVPDDETQLEDYAYILLDAPRLTGGQYGGTGCLTSWELAAELAKRHRLILAGGLTPSNVVEAIKQVQPFAVDVASGIETPTGITSAALIKQFIGATS